MKQLRLLVSVFCAFSCLVLPPQGKPSVAVPLAVPEWVNAAGQSYNGTNANVSQNSGDSICPSLQLDSSGNPCVAWEDRSLGNYEIFYIKWNGTQWVNVQGQPYPSNSAVVSQQDSRDSGLPCLILDKNNNPCISWQDNNTPNFTSNIFFVRWNGISWVNASGQAFPANSANVSKGSSGSGSSSLVLKPDGNPMIAWHDYALGNSEIFFVSWNGTSWINASGQPYNGTNANVSNNSGKSWKPSLILDPSGNPCIAWDDDSAGNIEIFYVRWNGTGWVTASGQAYNGTNANVSQNAGYSQYPSLQLDSSGSPLIAWRDITSGYFENFFVRWNNTNWVTADGQPYNGTNANMSQSSGYNSNPYLRLDRFNNPCIAWYNPNTREVSFVRWNNTSWFTADGQPYSGTNANVSQNSGDSRYPSLQLDSSGNPCIAWGDGTPGNYEIFFVRWNGTPQKPVGKSAFSLFKEIVTQDGSETLNDSALAGHETYTYKITANVDIVDEDPQNPGNYKIYVQDVVPFGASYVRTNYNNSCKIDHSNLLIRPMTREGKGQISCGFKDGQPNEGALQGTIVRWEAEVNSQVKKLEFYFSFRIVNNTIKELYSPEAQLISPELGGGIVKSNSLRNDVVVAQQNIIGPPFIAKANTVLDEKDYKIEIISPCDGDRVPIRTKFRFRAKTNIPWHLQMDPGLALELEFEYQKNGVWVRIDQPYKKGEQTISANRFLNPFFDWENLPLFILPELLGKNVDQTDIFVRIKCHVYDGKGIDSYVISNPARMVITKYPTLNYAKWADPYAETFKTNDTRKPLIFINGFSFFGSRAPSPLSEPPCWDDLLNRIKSEWVPPFSKKEELKPIFMSYKPYILHCDTTGSWMWNYYWHNMGETIPWDFIEMLLWCNADQMAELLFDKVTGPIGGQLGIELIEDVKKEVAKALGKLVTEITVDEVKDKLYDPVLGPELNRIFNSFREQQLLKFRYDIIEDLKNKGLIDQNGTWSKGKEKEIENLKFLYEPSLKNLEEIGESMVREIELQRRNDTFPQKDKNITIIGHSLGGLIGRAFMMSKWPGSNEFCGDDVWRLLTLATPHHGTPLANSFWGDVLMCDFDSFGIVKYDSKTSRYFYDLGKYPQKSSLTKDVFWDNYDENPRFVEKNPYLRSINGLKEYNSCSPETRMMQKIVAFGASNGYDPKNKNLYRILKYFDKLTQTFIPQWKTIRKVVDAVLAARWLANKDYLNILFSPWGEAITEYSNRDERVLEEYNKDYGDFDGVIPLHSTLFDGSSSLSDRFKFGKWKGVNTYNHASINSTFAVEVYDQVVKCLHQPIVIDAIKKDPNSCKSIQIEPLSRIFLEANVPTNANSTIPYLIYNFSSLPMKTELVEKGENDQTNVLTIMVPDEDRLNSWLYSSGAIKPNIAIYPNKINTLSNYENTSGNIQLGLSLRVGDEKCYVSSEDNLFCGSAESFVPSVIVELPKPKLAISFDMRFASTQYGKDDLMRLNLIIKNSSWADGSNSVINLSCPKELEIVKSSHRTIISEDTARIDLGTIQHKTSQIVEVYLKIRKETYLRETNYFSVSGFMISNNNYVLNDQTTIIITKNLPTEPLKMNIEWKGLNTKTNVVSLGAALSLQIRPTGGSSPYTINVEWGDGGRSHGVLEQKDAAVFDYSYKSKGEYEIVITCSDSFGRSARSSRRIRVE